MLLSFRCATRSQSLKLKPVSFHHFSTTRTVCMQPRFSQGTDEASAKSSLDNLLVDASNGGRWALTKEGEALERSFKFKTFAKTWVRSQQPHQQPRVSSKLNPLNQASQMNLVSSNNVRRTS